MNIFIVPRIITGGDFFIFSHKKSRLFGGMKQAITQGNTVRYNLRIFAIIFQPKIGIKIGIFSHGRKKNNILPKRSIFRLIGVKVCTHEKCQNKISGYSMFLRTHTSIHGPSWREHLRGVTWSRHRVSRSVLSKVRCELNSFVFFRKPGNYNYEGIWNL